MSEFKRWLIERFKIERKRFDRTGVYAYTQRVMAYNSNKIEGSTLTPEQTASLFDNGTLPVNDDYYRAKDVEEMNGHFLMFNHMLDTLEEELTENLIKRMHYELKSGVFEDRANGYAIGGWRKRANRVSDIQTALPQEVPEKIHQLLEKYHNAEKITLYDIAKFHAQFENIHPFQDGNGRVGRMIILKQCLDHNIVPVIIRDIHKAEYNRYLNKAQHEQDYKGLEAYFEKEQKYYQESTIPMIFDFDEL